jgi:hypothetical protein
MNLRNKIEKATALAIPIGIITRVVCREKSDRRFAGMITTAAVS